MPKISERNTRYSFSIAVAVLPTVALLYLMTRLILPVEGDQIVRQMIDRFELRMQRQVELKILRQLTNYPEIEPVPAREDFLSPQDLAANDDPDNFLTTDAVEDEPLTEESPENTIDWFSEARKVVEGSPGEHLARWRIDQGYDSYRSIMQGNMPSRTEQRVSARQADGGGVGQTHTNTYGEKEVKISGNCFMQIPKPSMDYFGATRFNPPRIYCNRPRRPDLSLSRK